MKFVFNFDFWTWFFMHFELDFCRLHRATQYTASKSQVWNRQKIKFKNQFYELEILKNQAQIDREKEGLTFTFVSLFIKNI
jgi:hypothetical protein